MAADMTPGLRDSNGHQRRMLYKIVLTGGPCGGKTTGQDRLSTFFENLGWKVFRVPETATVLIKGGIRFAELSPSEVFKFQEDLLVTLMRIEDTYFHLAESCDRNCLVICDRGTYDGSAYIHPSAWQSILKRNSLNPVDLRDNRYNQVVHLVTAARGAEDFYSIANNLARTETVEEAREKDEKTLEVWVGHPYVDIVDNKDCGTFEDKMLKLIQVVCDRAGVEYGDRLAKNSRKRKFLVTKIMEANIPPFQEFEVIHDYLHSAEPNVQARIRKRGQGGRWSHTHTVRRDVNGEKVETRMQISDREYKALRAHKDFRRCTTYKTRRCFMYEGRYYQLDIYQQPLPPQSPVQDQLIVLETYTTNTDKELPRLPTGSLGIVSEITDDPAYSMYNMSLRHDATPGAVGSKANPLDGGGPSSLEALRKVTAPPQALGFFSYPSAPRIAPQTALSRVGSGGGSEERRSESPGFPLPDEEVCRARSISTGPTFSPRRRQSASPVKRKEAAAQDAPPEMRKISEESRGNEVGMPGAGQQDGPNLLNGVP